MRAESSGLDAFSGLSRNSPRLHYELIPTTQLPRLLVLCRPPRRIVRSANILRAAPATLDRILDRLPRLDLSFGPTARCACLNFAVRCFCCRNSVEPLLCSLPC